MIMTIPIFAVAKGATLLTLLATGEGGFLSHTTIVLAATLKPLKLWLPDLVTSWFYLFSTTGENFSKMDWPGGLLQSFCKREVMKN